jgi:hypothetical protein
MKQKELSPVCRRELFKKVLMILAGEVITDYSAAYSADCDAEYRL